VVLLTSDDEGRQVGVGELKRRARQNVVLELGLFVGISAGIT
jgi:predicted nucleotide-binding protein